MPYPEDYDEAFDDEQLATLTESYGDEGWEPARSGEAIGPRYRRHYAGAAARPVPRPTPARPVGGAAGATIRGPGGASTQVRFEKPLATKESVDELAKELKRELAATAEAIKRVDQTLDKNTSILDKKVAALEAASKQGQQGAQMGMLLPLLLSKPPELDKVKFKTTPEGGTETTVESTTYKKDDNTGMLIALMAMTGGLGGGGGDSSNMLLMALAFGAFK
jgi:hypothetical protein